MCLYWHISEESIGRSWWLLGFFAGRQLHSLHTTTRMIARTASKPMTYSQATSFLDIGGRTLQLFDFLQADFAQENPEAYWNKMVGSLKARYGAWGYSIVSMFPLFFFKCFLSCSIYLACGWRSNIVCSLEFLKPDMSTMVFDGKRYTARMSAFAVLSSTWQGGGGYSHDYNNHPAGDWILYPFKLFGSDRSIPFNSTFYLLQWCFYRIITNVPTVPP